MDKEAMVDVGAIIHDGVIVDNG